MKVIAKTDNGYICELTGSEMSKIMSPIPKLGEDVDLKKLFDTLETLRNINNYNLKYIGREISKLQDRYHELEQVYSKCVILDQIKNPDNYKNE